MTYEHKDVPANKGANHVPYNWTYANAAARTGASGFVSADVGKLALQTDNNTLWMLTATTPTWALAGGNLGSAALLTAGTGANNLVQLNDSGKLPAVDGSLLTGISAGMPTGSVIAVASETVPAGYLECNGAAVSRTAYADLFAVIGIAHGYGDNSTTFNLPDYRGRFLRGWAHGSTMDPDRNSRTAMNTGGATGDHVGTVQDDQFEWHKHAALVYTTPGNMGLPAGSSTRTGGDTSGVGGNETRPTNANVMFCIKY
jgi:microcystin-dependent protein